MTEEDYTTADMQDDRELELLFQKLGGDRVWKAIARRKMKRLGRPEYNHTPHLLEMMCIMKRDGCDFRNQRAVAKAAREVANKRPAGRKDISKTLIKKFHALLKELWTDTVVGIMKNSIRMQITRAKIQAVRERWTPYSHLAEGAAVLAQLDEAERELANLP